jgi:hypothetical protein
LAWHWIWEHSYNSNQDANRSLTQPCEKALSVPLQPPPGSSLLVRSLHCIRGRFVSEHHHVSNSSRQAPDVKWKLVGLFSICLVIFTAVAVLLRRRNAQRKKKRGAGLREVKIGDGG